MYVVLSLLLLAHLCLGEDCVPRDYGEGSIVCVCNSTYCDTLPALDDFSSEGDYQVFTSNKAGLRFNKSSGSFSSSSSLLSGLLSVTIDTSTTYQTIEGFGTTFTDAAGINAASLPKAAADKLISSYYGSDGSEYNLGRVPIAGTDFSTYGYTYADEGNGTLDAFALKPEDYNYKIPYILQASDLSDDTLKLLASPWSSPAWSKDSGQLRGGLLIDWLYQLWADYFIRFFEEYEKEGVEFWAFTTQNEPAVGLIPGTNVALGWTPSLLIRWITQNLGPTIRNSSYSYLKLVIHDDQRTSVPLVQEYFANDEALSYIDGVAVHWYGDFITPSVFLESAKTPKKDVFLISTEACTGFLAATKLDKPVRLGSWERGTDYAKFIIEDLSYDSVGWIDWNFALNTDGGPNYIDNYVDSPIIVNATAGEFYKQPMYFTFAQFSKFIPRGSVRVSASTSLLSSLTGVETVAFQRPDGTIAVVLLNEGIQQDVTIKDSSRGSATITLTENSISTFVYA